MRRSSSSNSGSKTGCFSLSEQNCSVGKIRRQEIKILKFVWGLAEELEHMLKFFIGSELAETCSVFLEFESGALKLCHWLLLRCIWSKSMASCFMVSDDGS